MRGFFATYGTHDPLGHLDEPAQQEKIAETAAVCVETARKHCQPYHTMFPNQETSYDIVDNVSQLKSSCSTSVSHLLFLFVY
jgi:hypothetical protein